jgi:hypothetical protein
MIVTKQNPLFQPFNQSSAIRSIQEDQQYAERISQLNKTGKAGFLPSTLNTTDVIHFIWLGVPFVQQKQFSDNVLGFKRSFSKTTVILWTNPNPETNVFCQENGILLADVIDEIVKNMRKDLKTHYDRAERQIPPNYGMMSDILRYLILFEFGGTYLDVDIAPIGEEIAATSPQDNIFGGRIPEKTICIGSESIDEETQSIKNPFNNNALYAKKIHDPFWSDLIEDMIKYLNLNYECLSLVREQTKLTRYRRWFTIIASGPCCLSRAIKSSTIEIGAIPLTTGLGAASWCSGPVEFATTYTSTSLEEETDLLNRAILAVIDELPRGRVKALHYLPLLDKFTFMTPSEAREKFLSAIEETLTKLPANASRIGLIFAENNTEYQRLAKAIPKELNDTIENDLRTTLKILKIKETLPDNIDKNQLALSIARLEKKPLHKAIQIIIDKKENEIFDAIRTTISNSNKKNLKNYLIS